MARVVASASRGWVPETIWRKVGTNLHLREGHPLCTLRASVQNYFERIAPGEFRFFNDLHPVVSTYDCFDSLCVPKNHVSRALSDTYYVDENRVLRAHMTAHDVTLMRQGLKSFVNCGDVYRRDTVDRTHYPVFHQIDGLRIYRKGEMNNIDEELKSVLEGLARELFGRVEMRWVNAYFPFTNPSWELEVKWRDEWLELLGCGGIRREVLNNGGVEAEYEGWAFGLGLERLAMVLFDIPDIRLFWSEDERVIGQFRGKGLNARYKPISVFPGVEKDVSFWIEPGFHMNDIHEIARLEAGDLVENVQVIDEFEKNGRTSLCVRVMFRSMERSLTHKEVNLVFDRFRKRVGDELNVELR